MNDETMARQLLRDRVTLVDIARLFMEGGEPLEDGIRYWMIVSRDHRYNPTLHIVERRQRPELTKNHLAVIDCGQRYLPLTPENAQHLRSRLSGIVGSLPHDREVLVGVLEDKITAGLLYVPDGPTPVERLFALHAVWEMTKSITHAGTDVYDAAESAQNNIDVSLNEGDYVVGSFRVESAI